LLRFELNTRKITVFRNAFITGFVQNPKTQGRIQTMWKLWFMTRSDCLI